jgi:hypothetical protein
MDVPLNRYSFFTNSNAFLVFLSGTIPLSLSAYETLRWLLDEYHRIKHRRNRDTITVKAEPEPETLGPEWH